MIAHVPEFDSDAEAEAFLEQDLSGLDFSQFKAVQFEFAAGIAPERVGPVGGGQA